jgi:DNA-binding protein H-NS
MQRSELKQMGVEDLWGLHLEISEMLGKKLEAKRKLLDDRIKRLSQQGSGGVFSVGTDRRPYPPVLPKFRNPEQPSETWAGRGKRPRWLTKLLRAGGRLDDFRIRSAG